MITLHCVIQRLKVGIPFSVFLLLCSLPLQAAFGDSYADEYSIAISPDGQMAAYVWVETKDWPLSVERTSLSQKAFVKWSSLAHPKEQESLQIDSVDFNHKYDSLESYIRLSFSPDSNQLLVMTFLSLLRVDLATQKYYLLANNNECITSFAWLGDDEIAYVAHTGIKANGFAERTFWRQSIYSASHEREKVYAERRVDTGIGTWTGHHDPLEHWSPNGTVALFMTPNILGQLQLLNIKTGKVNLIGNSPAVLDGIAWKADETAAVCILHGPQSIQALLVDPTTLSIYDFSEDFSKAFSGRGTSIDSVWPAQSDYFIVNDPLFGGCLLRVKPFDLKLIGSKIQPQSSLPDARPPWVHWMPLNGWVQGRVVNSIWVDALSEVVAENQWIAFDSITERTVVIPRMIRAWTPDCETYASVSQDGLITSGACSELVEGNVPEARSIPLHDRE